MRSLLKLLLIPLIAYGIAMGYLWYKIKNGADEAISAATPVAGIKYGSIHLSPLGDQIGLKDIVITPTMTNDKFHIEQVNMTGPYPGFFLIQGKDLSSGEPPDKLGIEIKRLKIDLNSEIFSIFEKMEEQINTSGANDPLSLLLDLDALGCGNKTSFTLEDYRKMGIGISILNLSSDIRYSKDMKNMQLGGIFNVEGLYTLNTTTDIAIGQKGTINTKILGQRIPNSSIQIHDTGYHTLRNRYCTDLNEGIPTSYIDHNRALIMQKTGLGLTDKETTAYKEFKRDGGTMNIKIEPTTNISFGDLKYYKPVDIIKMLGIKVEINGTTLNFIQGDMGATSHTKPKKVQENKKKFDPHTLHRIISSKTTDTDTATSHKPSYKTIKISDANKYINEQVEITTLEGKTRSGILEKVNNDRLYLTIKLSAGSIIYPIENIEINRVRVKL